VASSPLPVIPPAAARAIDVVGLGESSVDLVAELDHYPEANSKQRISSLSSFVGGQVATAMVACARLGWRARYVGCLGTDAEGAAIVETLTRAGVDVRIARRAGHRSRSAIILVDRRSGGRTVLEHRDPAVALGPGDVAPEAVTDGRILLVDATDPRASARAAALARAASIPVVLDVERAAGDAEETTALLRSVDIVIAAEAFPMAFTKARTLGEALRQMEQLAGAALVVVTLGAAGSLARCHGREIRTPAFRVEAVDTTGAGDAFRGGFIGGWLLRWPTPEIDTVLEYANAVAAMNCRAMGAQGGLPSRAEVDAFVTRTLRGESK
jgi:sulfofructose kinase